jgi:hypothetical protein
LLEALVVLLEMALVAAVPAVTEQAQELRVLTQAQNPLLL